MTARDGSLKVAGGLLNGYPLHMSDKAPKKIEDEPGADERFERGIAKALATPPKPHAANSTNQSPKGKRAKDRPQAS